jgi:hypothetical protein
MIVLIGASIAILLIVVVSLAILEEEVEQKEIFEQFENATLLTGAVSEVTGSLDNAQSVYYKLWLDEGQGYDIEVEGDVDVTFYKPDFSEGGRLGKSEQTFSLSWFAESSGYHYIVVQSVGPTHYTLTVKVAQLAQPGETFETATDISLGVKYEWRGEVGPAGSVHYYGFYVEPDNDVDVGG